MTRHIRGVPGNKGRKPGSSTLLPIERYVVPDAVVGDIGPMRRALVGYDPRAHVPRFDDELSRARTTAARPNRKRPAYDLDDEIETTDDNRREETDDGE